MEWINFRHLFAFWAVCRYGGFRRAAERVHVSQSTVSEQVKALEDYLGEELLERSTRSHRVTDRGAALLEYADEIFSRSHEINRIFRDKADRVAVSNIRVGLEGGISRNFVFRRIQQALERDSGLRIDLVDGSFEALSALLRSFELDLIFSLDRPRPRDLLTVEHVRVASSPLCLVGTPEVLRGLVESPKDASVELYMFRRPFEGAPLPTVIAEQYGVEVQVPVYTDDISLLRFLANGGRGLAVMPAVGVQEDLRAGHAQSLPIDGGPSIEVFAMFLAQGVRRHLIEDFLAPR